MKVKQKYLNVKSVQICNHCGDPVYFGSGKFVNRVPDLNDIPTRIENGLLFPFGDYVCDDCDRHFLTGNL